MTQEQNLFLELSVVKQWTYDQISKETGISRKILSKWWNDLKDEREILSKIRQIWIRKCPKTKFWDFHRWYTETPRTCHYCGINEEQIKKLIESRKITTKRLTTRGKTLEIERLEPNKGYDDTENLVYSCYWCNNAKTDEFSESEFKPIGREIANIWKSRLLSI